MDFRVNYLTLYDISKKLETENETLKDTLSKLIEIINELESGWAGPDYDNFKIAATSYIESLEITTANLGYIAYFMGKSAKVYSETDEGWAKRVRRVGD